MPGPFHAFLLRVHLARLVGSNPRLLDGLHLPLSLHDRLRHRLLGGIPQRVWHRGHGFGPGVHVDGKPLGAGFMGHKLLAAGDLPRLIGFRGIDRVPSRLAGDLRIRPCKVNAAMLLNPFDALFNPMASGVGALVCRIFRGIQPRNEGNWVAGNNYI